MIGRLLCWLGLHAPEYKSRLFWGGRYLLDGTGRTEVAQWLQCRRCWKVLETYNHLTTPAVIMWCRIDEKAAAARQRMIDSLGEDLYSA